MIPEAAKRFVEQTGFDEKSRPLTAWDIYNVATEIYKPGRTDIPAMIPQNILPGNGCERGHTASRAEPLVA